MGDAPREVVGRQPGVAEARRQALHRCRVSPRAKAEPAPESREATTPLPNPRLTPELLEKLGHPRDLLEQFRRAVYWRSGPPRRATVNGELIEAISCYVAMVHGENGGPFPPIPVSP